MYGISPLETICEIGFDEVAAPGDMQDAFSCKPYYCSDSSHCKSWICTQDALGTGFRVLGDREISSDGAFPRSGRLLSSGEQDRGENIQFGKFRRQTEFRLAVKLLSCLEFPGCRYEKRDAVIADS